MQLIATLLLAGCLATTVTGAADTSRHRPPRPEPCTDTLTIGHVPGHLDPVWELRCAITEAGDSSSSWQHGAVGISLGPVRAAADATVAASAGPIVVADAYHGTGFVVCPNGERPVAVADAYHGTGTNVCP